MWIDGDSIVKRADEHLISKHKDFNLSLDKAEVVWKGESGLHVDTMSRKCESHLGMYPPSDIIIIAWGTNDLVDIKENNIINMLRETIH